VAVEVFKLLDASCNTLNRMAQLEIKKKKHFKKEKKKFGGKNISDCIFFRCAENRRVRFTKMFILLQLI
jgi:hypothetical protein